MNNLDFRIIITDKDLMEYKNNGLITDSVLAYFRVMLDRLILFDFKFRDKKTAKS